MNRGKWTTNQIVAAIVGPVLVAAIFYALTWKPATTKPAPRIVEFRVGGEKEDKSTKTWSIDLMWTTRDADTVTIEPMVGKVEPVGFTTVKMTKSGSFLLKAENPKGKVEYSLEIELPVR